MSLEWSTAFWTATFSFLVCTLLIKVATTQEVKDFKALGLRDRGLLDIVGTIKNTVVSIIPENINSGVFGTLGNIVRGLRTAKSLLHFKVPNTKLMPSIFKLKEQFMALKSPLSKNVGFIMNTTAVLQKQEKTIVGKFPGLKLGEPIINSLNLGLETVTGASSTIDQITKQISGTMDSTLKTIDQVTSIVESNVESMACVILSTYKRYPKDACEACRRTIPDFVTKKVAETTSRALLKKFSSTAKEYPHRVTNLLKRGSVVGVRYLDKVMTCQKSDPNQCRDSGQESVILDSLSTGIEAGGELFGLFTNFRTLIDKSIGNLLSRVASTHAAYESCLTSGVPESVKMKPKPAIPEVDTFYDKMKEHFASMKKVSVSQVAIKRFRNLKRYRS